ncbi:MAG: LCP family protein [Microcystaceae cyanobacterium]
MTVDKSYAKRHPNSSPPPKRRKKSKRKFFLKGLFLGLGLTGVAVLSATAGAFIALSLSTAPLRQASLSETEEAVFNQEEAISYKSLRLPELSRPVNILVVGTKVLTSETTEEPPEDLGYHALVNSFEGLADTLLLVRFEPMKDTVTVLSIPRDTKAEIPGYGVRKINDANSFGGPALTAETVSNLLDGVPIDRYIRINVQGVEKLIDALGGVDVYVPKDMKYTDHSQHLYIDLKKGQQRLNGEKAVQFLRFRQDEFGDIGRVQRQQILMRALVEQALKPQVLLKLSDILAVIQENIDTNVSVEEILALGGFAGQTQRENVQMLMLPGYFGEGEENYSYWLPASRRINTMVAHYFDPNYMDTIAYKDPTDLRITLQDTTEDPEAVQTMRTYLIEQGYRRVHIGKEGAEPLNTTKIIAQQGDDLGASAIRGTLNVGEILVESTGNLGSDITIQVGQDWRIQMVDLEDNSWDYSEKQAQNDQF